MEERGGKRTKEEEGDPSGRRKPAKRSGKNILALTSLKWEREEIEEEEKRGGGKKNAFIERKRE